MRRTSLALTALTLGTTLGCTTMATITNVQEEPCQRTFATALADIVRAEGEPAEHAQRIIDQAPALGATFDYGPRPFMIRARSGTDYSFFVEKKGEQCLVRLYGRQKGFVRYTNNLTYIQTQELPGCHCAE